MGDKFLSVPSKGPRSTSCAWQRVQMRSSWLTRSNITPPPSAISAHAPMCPEGTEGVVPAFPHVLLHTPICPDKFLVTSRGRPLKKVEEEELS